MAKFKVVVPLSTHKTITIDADEVAVDDMRILRFSKWLGGGNTDAVAQFTNWIYWERVDG